MPGDTSDTCRCGESILCDGGNVCGPRVESSSETVTIIDTHLDGFSILIKYAREGSSRRRLIYGTLLPMSGLIYSRSRTCTKSKGWSYTMRQRCETWQERKLWLHFYDGQFRHISLRANLSSWNTHIWLGSCMHWSSRIYAQSP
jgi:hypothetical protein